MAKLIPCKECGHQVARKAKTCPSCGVGKPAVKSSSLGQLFLIALILVIPVTIFFGEAGLDTPSRSAAIRERRAAAAAARLQERRKLNARIYAERQVGERLKAPRNAEFSGYGDTVVGRLRDSENRWVIRGWVDAENSFGAMLRSDYQVVVEFEEGSDDRLRLVSVDIQ